MDAAIAGEVLRVLEPSAVEAAVRATQQKTEKQDDILRALDLELQSVRYQAERAQRQYDLVDPENRLVSEELERRWNAALAKVREIEIRIEEARHHRHQMTPPGPQLFQTLHTDLQAVWNEPKTDARLKKRIVRTLLEEVIADVDSQAGEIVLVLHWKGGTHTELRIRRRRRGQNSNDTSMETIQVVRILASICADNWIAAFLNRNGLCTGPGNRWTPERVVSLRNYHGIPVYSEERRRSEGWMNLGEAACHLNAVPKTLRLAAQRGDVPSLHPLGDGPWVFKRADLDLPRVRERIKARSLDRSILAGRYRSQLSLDLSET